MYVDPQRNNEVRRLTLKITPKEELAYHQPRPANENIRSTTNSREQSPAFGHNLSRMGTPTYMIPKDEIQILKERQAQEELNKQKIATENPDSVSNMSEHDILQQEIIQHSMDNEQRQEPHKDDTKEHVTISQQSGMTLISDDTGSHLENSDISEDMLLHGRVTSGKYGFKDFQILRTLGTGSFGRVHLIRSNHNGRFYALKVLKKKTIVKFKQVEHTNDERKMLSIISHPFIVRMWGTFQDSQQLFMVMDFVEGGELFSLLRKSKRFPSPVAKFYAAEICLALEYLHELDIIYRDLKPENILLDKNGHIKITDFGFAKYVPDVTYTLCGTPDYIAPEVVSTKPYNKSVDWWSFGILIYEMLCGHTPFCDANSIKTYENIMNAPLKFPSYFEPTVQDLLRGLINRNLSQRLGNLQKGTEDVKNHPWFEEVIWEKILARCIETPYEPPIRQGHGDCSQFDRYPEEIIDYGCFGEDPFGDLFKDF